MKARRRRGSGLSRIDPSIVSIQFRTLNNIFICICTGGVVISSWSLLGLRVDFRLREILTELYIP